MIFYKCYSFICQLFFSKHLPAAILTVTAIAILIDYLIFIFKYVTMDLPQSLKNCYPHHFVPIFPIFSELFFPFWKACFYVFLNFDVLSIHETRSVKHCTCHSDTFSTKKSFRAG